MKYIGGYLVNCLREVVRGMRGLRRNPYGGKTSIESDTLAELETYAKSLGISDIGYTRVNPKRIFRGFDILFPNAIVFTMEMDREKIRKAPSTETFIEIFRTYHQLGVIVNEVAEWLRARGYNAHPSPAIGGEVDYVPLAQDAALGEVGKNGLLVTRANGPRVRLAAVYTDIDNLPLATGENPHRWVRDYCVQCNVCVDRCPANAIYREPAIMEDGDPVFIDFKKCALPFSNDEGCTICIKVCPFSAGTYDRLKTRVAISK